MILRKILFIIFIFDILVANDFINQQREFVNENERINSYEQKLPISNLKLQENYNEEIQTLPIYESFCFEVDKIDLNKEVDLEFKLLLKSTLNKMKFIKGMCLGENSINAIVKVFNNEIIKAGFITSYVIPKNLNLKSRKIVLELVFGKINSVLINNDDNVRNRASIFTAFGRINEQEILNIREIETALENISNATFGQTDISLSPSNLNGYSDILITRQQRYIPLSTRISIDNFGSKSTGLYQGTLGISALNLLGFNEIYTINYGGNILKKHNTYLNNEKNHGNSHNFYGNFKIPFGAFSIDYTHSRYNYNQIVVGAYGLYRYSGNSRLDKLNLNYLAYRNYNTKLNLFFTLFKRASKNYIDEFELDNQRRISAGYEIGAKIDKYFNNTIISSKITYKKGTGMLGAIPAPEQFFGEGTNRFKILLLDFGVNKRFANSFIYEANFHGQYNFTPLTMQDKISIGGIYSIRGFDGEMSLSGQKGFYLQNTLAYEYYKNHQIYMAFDGGAVFSSNSDYNEDNELLGIGFGIRGNVDTVYGGLNYDLLLSRPIKKPKFFQSKIPIINFTISYQF